METTISEIELAKLKNASEKYIKILARSSNYKKEHIEYTVKYNREYMARKMLDPEYKKRHYESIKASRAKRIALNKLENPPPVRFRTKKHVFESDTISKEEVLKNTLCEV